jgi:hypothetical protein
MYTPKHFVIQEFIPPDVYEKWGAKSIMFVDERVLITADALREALGPMIVNTWHSPKLIKAYGMRTESGLRSMETKTGAQWSQHKFGRAADALFARHSAAAVRKFVITNIKDFPHIGCIEDGVSWFHFDVRNTVSQRLEIIKP